MQVRKPTRLTTKIITNIILISLNFLFLSNADASLSAWQQDKSGNSKVRIIASSFTDQDSNQKLIIGLDFQIKDGWKIYGNDPGSTIGLPPIFDFSNSTNFQNDQIIWPKAALGEEKIGDEVIKYSYYHDEVVIPIEVTLKDYNQLTNLKIRIDYGLCKDVCIPASVEFDINLGVLETDSEALSLIQKYYQPKLVNQETLAIEFSSDQSKNSLAALFTALIAAFIGGMILNIMPCVLPVLSIKLISVINHSNTTIARIRLAFLSTMAGIVFCFLIFASVTSIAKLSGNNLGWGLQFQNRYFLVFLILILSLFSANLLGLFEISFNQIMATILNKKISNHLENNDEARNKNIFIGNFLSGILAVLLATPCSAPFLGLAISFALTQNVAIIFLIFITIAIGVCTPYILLFIAPKLVYLLPKPGQWMIKVKKLMAMFLLMTIIWLFSVLAANAGTFLTTIILLISCLIILSLKIRFKFLRYLLVILMILGAFMVSFLLRDQKTPIAIAAQMVSDAKIDNVWKEFNQAQIPILVSQGKTVLIDVTANWCLTCKLNKALVLTNKKVVAKLNNPNIVAMRADITKPDKEVMDFLRANKRFAIPFNAVYGPKIPNGKVTSELLKIEELLQLINQASNNND
jgi:suppressor for copper-sensitivity B